MHRNLGIGSWIARRARMTPDRIALIAGDRRTTYAQLDERVTRLARALATLGVGECDRVAVLGDNDSAVLETLFACGLLGAIAVLLHPGFATAALREVLLAAGPRVLVFTPRHAARARQARRGTAVAHAIRTAGFEPDVLCYESLVADASAEPIDRSISLDATCLLAFSSGTTGPNKGVALSHGNVLFNVINLLSCLDYVRDDVFLASAPLHRMGGLGFMLPVLFKGATCVLQERADARESLELIARHRVSVMFDTPRVFDAIAREPAFATLDPSCVRIAVTGGAIVSPALIATYLARGVRLRQGYGLTEAAPVALVLDDDEVADHVGAAGRPPLYGAVRVVTSDLDDAPSNRVGELLYHGPNVMHGYWQDPAATAAAVVEDGWLRTGDAAIQAADGVVTIAGRMTDALVCDGTRVQPGPIEQDLRDELGLDCALVQARPEARVVAFVATPAAQLVDTDRIAAICAPHLPAGRAPEIRVIDVIPRNPNGKLLRGELRARPVGG